MAAWCRFADDTGCAMSAAVNIRAVNALIAQQSPESRIADAKEARGIEIFEKWCAGVEPHDCIWNELVKLAERQAEIEFSGVRS